MIPLRIISARSESAILLPAARTCAVRASNSASFSTSIASRERRLTETLGSGFSESIAASIISHFRGIERGIQRHRHPSFNHYSLDQTGFSEERGTTVGASSVWFHFAF